MTQSQDENSPKQSSLYAHLSQNGDVFIIADDTRRGLWVDIARFKAELQRIKDTEGMLYISVEQVEVDAGSPLEILINLVNSYQISVRDVPRHPAVLGYNRSFAASLWEAVDIAREDVEGTKGLLENAEYWLTQVQNGTSDSSFWSGEIARLKTQLEYAEMAYRKLKDLEFELTNDPQGGEN